MREQNSRIGSVLRGLQAVFLDRDGVINEEAGIISRVEELRLIPGAGKAIARLNRLEIPVIVITNQPVVARGWLSEQELEDLHDHLRRLLAAEGATVDAIYACPHHENANDARYRIVCDCRKPQPGLLYTASRDFDLNVEHCLFVGDRTVDLQAARSAGCLAVLVKTGFAGGDGKCDVEPDLVVEDLSALADLLQSSRAES